MVLGRVGAHDEDTVTVLYIDPMVRHGTATERLCQSRNRRAVSQPGLVLDINQAERS